MPAGRVAGKAGYSTNYYNGRSYVGINEEIMWVSIGMGITIALLITIALCYIAREKCQKRQRAATTAALAPTVKAVHKGTKGKSKNKYNVVKVNGVYNVGGDSSNYYFSLYANHLQHQQQQRSRATTATTTEAPTISNNRITTNNSTSSSGSISQISGNMGSNHQQQQQQYNSFNFRLLNERQQQHQLYPLQHYLYNQHQEQQPPQQYLNAFYVSQPIIAEDNAVDDDDDDDPRPQLPQAEYHQQYANNQSYGTISSSIGLNIGSWCTRSWG